MPIRPAPAQAGFTLRAQAGFTLIEMIVVLAILGLLGALVLARGPARSAGLEVRLAADAVAQTFRVARSRAMAGNVTESVAFDSGHAIWRLGDGAAQTLPAGLAVAVTTTAAEIAGPFAAILFFPDGSSNGGQVELAGRGHRALVVVNWLTGQISIRSGTVPD